MEIEHHNDAFMSHQAMPHKTRSHPRFNATHVAQTQTHTAGHCKHPLWLLYNLCSTYCSNSD